METFRELTRRRFVQYLAGGAIALPALHALGSSALGWAAPAQSNTPAQNFVGAPTNLPWRIVMVTPDEPGEPMVIRGTIFGDDGRTPLEGARLYVYHTDARGYYNAKRSFSDPPRLRGWMRTGPGGQYEFRTIKPAPYPGQQIPAHIHPTADAPAYPAQWIDEYWFEGDRFLKPEDIAKNRGKGAFSPIVKLTRDSSGVLVGVRDLRLSKEWRPREGA